LRYRFGIETVPHLLCIGFTREETEDALIELNYLGIRNVLALQGDRRGAAKPISPYRTENAHAADLVQQIAAMNRGEYLHDLVDVARSDFCIGVAGYPEGHFESPNERWDVEHLRQKVDAGAEYVVTQMFFHNHRYFDFVQRCREQKIDVPIIPGLKILTTKKQLVGLPRAFHVEIPDPLAAEVEAAEPGRVADIGVEWAASQAEELLERGAPGVHFYVLQSSRVVTRVVARLRGRVG
jgi:methylenetetrahydrofolate reductase (NADPH)